VSEKGVRLAQTTQAGPCISGEETNSCKRLQLDQLLDQLGVLLTWRSVAWPERWCAASRPLMSRAPVLALMLAGRSRALGDNGGLSAHWGRSSRPNRVGI
jgi:hypothetical protein